MRISATCAGSLRSSGSEASFDNDSVPGIPKVLSFKDPKGTTIELFSDWNLSRMHHQVIGVGPLKLGHVAFVVDDAKKIADFYERFSASGFPTGWRISSCSCAAARTITP